MDIIINNQTDLANFYKHLRKYKSLKNKEIYKLKKTKNISQNDIFELEYVINALNIKNEYDRLKYVYDAYCKCLDKYYIETNICEFDKNGLCRAQRDHKTKTNINGCCGSCKYCSKQGCTIKCITCKIMFCKYIKKVKEVPNPHDIKIYKYFFTLPQKLISEESFWTEENEVIKSLYKANIFTWLFNKNKKMKRY